MVRALTDESARRLTALETYKRELLRWNEKINLIGPEAKRISTST